MPLNSGELKAVKGEEGHNFIFEVDSRRLSLLEKVKDGKQKILLAVFCRLGTKVVHRNLCQVTQQRS